MISECEVLASFNDVMGMRAYWYTLKTVLGVMKGWWFQQSASIEEGSRPNRG